MKSPSRLTIALDQLRYGHEADPPINARRTGRAEGIAELAASIDAHGLIQALTIRESAGTPYVADGNRRLAALRLLAEQGKIAADEEIKCDLDVSTTDAEELSAAANIMRVPLHEADQYETFRELAERGLDEKKIASRFGIEPKRVTRMLALGRLSPVVLSAWREDRLGREAAQCVQAFTLAPSLEAQEETFRRLEKDHALWPHTIRRAFGAGDRETARLMNFVGVKDYVAAGGSVTEDLFGEDHAVSDPALAKKLADDKLHDKCDKLRAVGWKWAEREEDLPSNWSYSWQRLPVKKSSASAEDKMKSGCVVRLDYDGKLDITYGVVRPELAKQTSEAGAEKKPATISAALMERLSVQATLATRKALAQDRDIGLVALLAGFLAGGHYLSPVRVRHEGLGHYETTERESFDAAFARLCAMSNDELFDIAAGIAGAAVDLKCSNPAATIFNDNVSEMVSVIDGDRMRAALAEAFDAEDYFNSVPKPFLLTAIGEAIGAEYVDKAAKLKKPELVAYALKHIPSTGWLPPELRTVHYTGPGSSADQLADAAE